MKLNHILYPAMFGCLFSLYSCVEDKGSYDHLPVNEITVTGTEKTYSVLAGITELTIEPTITGSILGEDDSQYEYTWYACKKELGSDKHTHTVLGNEKNLKTTVVMNPGSYYLYLIINDHSTGMEWVISDMTLQVSTSLTTGFYVLGEKEDGVIGMDFLSMPNSEGDTTMIHDIFTNTEQLKGAKDLLYTGYISNPSVAVNLWLITETGSYKLENSIQEKTIFDIDPSYNEGFTFPSQLIKHPVKVADQFPHQGIYSKAYDTSNRGFITEDGVFANSIISGEIFASPINRYESSSTKLFKPYPLGFCNPYGRMSAVVFYDMDAECFVYLKNMYTKVCAKMTETPGAFPWEQNKRTIVYGENGPVNSYALMKSTENNTDYFIYQMTINYATVSKNSAYSFSTADATDIDKATFYSFSYEYPIMIYVAGNNLYQYNYETKACKVVKTYPGEITYASFEWQSRGELDIVVCTYEEAAEADKRGTIYKYTMGQDLNIVPIMTGPALDKEFVYNTPLKVKKIEYRNCPR